MPQSWNRYAYCLNNPFMYVDPDGLTWYKKKGGDQPEWFDDNPGADYEEITQHVYWGGDESRWVALNPLKNEFKTGFHTENAAIHYNDPGQDITLADSVAEMSMFTGLGGLARGVFGFGARLGARFFAREAAETATEVVGPGPTMQGLAFERRFLLQHLDGTPQAASQIARDGKAFVFNDLSTLSLKYLAVGYLQGQQLKGPVLGRDTNWTLIDRLGCESLKMEQEHYLNTAKSS